MADEEKLTTGRGPGYPYIDLAKTLERVQQVYDAGVRNTSFAPETYYSKWGLGTKSSGSRQTMAALKHFGMVDYEGSGKERKVALSDLALKIAQDKRPNSSERAVAIKKAALEPNIHASIYKRFPPPMPDDVFVTHVLVSEYGYSESSADAVLKGFKASIEFANLDEPDGLSQQNDDHASSCEDVSGDDNTQFEVGDLIQGTVGGVDVFPKGARVLGLSDDGDWIYHDFGTTPLEVKAATLIEKAKTPDPMPPAMPAHLLTSLKQPHVVNDTLPEGASILSSGKVRDVSFEVRVIGAVNKDVVERIIAYLELAKMDYV